MELQPTREQQKIINFTSGEAMVKAGAGCAKTTTLGMRTGHLVKLGFETKSIVILTYSKALTKDISNTLEKFLDDDVAESVTVTTIHAFGYHLIKQYSKRQGLTHPLVLKDRRKRRLLNRYKKKYDLKISELKRAFHLYETRAPKMVIAELGEEKALQATKAYKAYTRYKEKHNKVDYEDMVKQALAILKTPDGSALVGSYEHLMIDELQDINGSQKDLIIAISKYMTSTVLVGDTHQLIYQWRQASLRHWSDITEALGAKHLTLSESFRIPRQALPFVNDLGRQIDKNAKPLTSHVKGGTPILVDLPDQDAQYRWLADKIKSLKPDKDKLQKIAILGKTHRELSMITTALRARGINVTESKFPTGINEHREHLLALIELTRLEKRRLQKSPKRLSKAEKGLAAVYIEKLWLSDKLIGELKERLEIKPKSILSVKSKSRYYNQIRGLSIALQKAAVLPNVVSAIQCLIDATKPILKNQNENKHKLLLRDLIDIKIKARDCATLDDIDHKWFDAPKGDNNGISLMTVHGAKGKEWDYVFLINVVDGVYPRYGTKRKSLIDELRVFYVAVTRHHKQLFILQAPLPHIILSKKSKGKSGKSNHALFETPSPFIHAENQGLICDEFKVL